MSNIDDILVNFSDYELSVFYTFRLQDYMQATQDKIKSYIFNERNLTNESISYYLNKMAEMKGTAGLIVCPRCKSSKLQKDSLDESSSNFSPEWKDPTNVVAVWLELKTGELQQYSKVSCLVCGDVLYDKYDDEKLSSRNFFRDLIRGRWRGFQW